MVDASKSSISEDDHAEFVVCVMSAVPFILIGEFKALVIRKLHGRAFSECYCGRETNGLSQNLAFDL